ncbi:MAG TPA: TetR/AcrR family transcriptional regulator [Nocardioidaceae bacterium]|nr:TetR/AcrR family transcriptional regulator [Nocardioidaceae bacterium]
MTVEDRRRTSAATRAELLDATKRLLTGGASVSGLNVEKIVREAGMSRATFYLHFTDKTELVAALAEDLFSWREYIGAEVLADPGMKRETLDIMLDLIVARWAENQAVLAAIIEVAEYDDAISTAWRGAMLHVAETAAIQLRARWTAMPESTGDPTTIAEIFTWMFERSCHQMLRNERRQEEIASSMAEIIWRVISYSDAAS